MQTGDVVRVITTGATGVVEAVKGDLALVKFQAKTKPGWTVSKEHQVRNLEVVNVTQNS